MNHVHWVYNSDDDMWSLEIKETNERIAYFALKNDVREATRVMIYLGGCKRYTQSTDVNQLKRECIKAVGDQIYLLAADMYTDFHS